MRKSVRDIWTDIWIPVLSGLITALLTYLPGIAFRKDIWNARVPFWILPAFFAAFAGVLIYGIRRLRRTEEAHNVLVVLSAFERHTYFAEVLRYVIASLDEVSTSDGLTFQAVLKIPRSEYDVAKQKRHLDDALKRRREYAGALIVPVEPHSSRRDLADFIRRFERPVVFFETNPGLRTEEYTPHSCFIGINDRLGGELAARAMVHELGNISRPRILILPGGFHEDREEAFKRAVLSAMPDAVIVIADSAHFERDRARKVAEGYLAAAAKRGLAYDGAFCTGDEMALGLLDAVRHSGGVSEQLVLIGYDGINEARRLIDRPGSCFKNTVVQDTRSLGQTVVRQLQDLWARERDFQPETLLPPQLYHTVGSP